MSCKGGVSSREHWETSFKEDRWGSRSVGD